jgi:RND family efflux transporter MFP subunit
VYPPDARHSRKAAAATEVAFDALDEEAQGTDALPASRNATAQVDEHGHIQVPTGYPRATGKWLGLFVALLAAALVVGFFIVNHLKRGEEASLREEAIGRVRQPPPVEVIRVQAAPASQTLLLPGETQGWYSSTIYARVTGYVAQWLVDIGDIVIKDQVMAIIDTPDLDAQLAAAKAQLEASEAEAKVKESDAEFAKTTYVRWQTASKGIVSDQEREDKKAQYQSSVAQLNAARARINLDRANVDRFTYLTRFKEVTAPYDGVVTERHVDIGNLVTAGTTNTTPLFGIAQYDRIRVFIDAPQSARIDLGVGVTAQVSAAELPNRIFEGTVARTSQAADPRARTVRVEIDLPNADDALVPGIYVQVMFHLQERATVQVPASAMIFNSGGPQVALIARDDVVKFQSVSIARDNGKFVEIASGVAQGDRVAVNISNEIVDGEKVTVRENSEVARNGTK